MKKSVSLKKRRASSITRNYLFALLYTVVAVISSSHALTYNALGLAALTTLVWFILQIRQAVVLKHLRQQQVRESIKSADK